MQNLMSRRNILKAVPVVAGGTMLAGALPSLASAACSEAASSAVATAGDKTRVTYFQVAMQKRWPVNEKLVREKSYSKFFTKNLEAPIEMVNLLEKGPLANEYVLTPTPENLNKMISNYKDYPVSGYSLVEEGPLAYAQSRHVFPGVTAKMFEWWFTWHPLESERYMLWFPYAHIHNSVVDPKRLANEKLTYAQRLYGNPNHITEYIGSMHLDGLINFDDPINYGIKKELLAEKGFTFNASGIITPFDAPNTPLVLMIHLARDTPQGLEMINRYWIGTHPSFDRFKQFPNGAKLSANLIQKMHLDKEALENFAYEMALHDMTEFTCLGGFLADIYKEYANKA
ncbi:DAPG hydrolase family protein [Pseudomonas chlororaphis]|uniref:DAPG hydrolase family protein n=1 Tax=Pseudomonas chlororaphis TaxID=587753 RepID=UPI001927DC75|nr:2,4-diacetylphloroglucinol hydrolase [Pseudomonas chlororaphis]QQX57451.1 2,4-diacetylphloroglucinol hydrolase [Pseudomonas chlororaphis subsp. aurantiaca]